MQDFRKSALITGGSRGIGAQTAQILGRAGLHVCICYRNKEKRAAQVIDAINAEGKGKAFAVRADLVNREDVDAMVNVCAEKFGTLDILVLNASGGMEADMPKDYAMMLNKDAQVYLAQRASEIMSSGGRIVFITSHQAHFIHTHPTIKEYEPVALSKRAGEDALLDMAPGLKERGIDFVVVSGDMILGTATATLLNRIHPGIVDQRRKEVGKLYTVEEFAEEIANVCMADSVDGNLVLVGEHPGSC